MEERVREWVDEESKGVRKEGRGGGGAKGGKGRERGGSVGL